MEKTKYPLIFYVCSLHAGSTVAEDHKKWQGKIYVDRYWRSMCEKAGMKDFLIKSIESYIFRNEIRTVQWIIGPPVYMCTRPYCKHEITPIDTLTVLTSEAKELVPITYERRTPRGRTYEYIKKRLK